MKILISGGHLTPALAMIDYIQTHCPTDQLVFIGRKYSQEKLKQKAVEYDEISQRQIEFHFFEAPKLGFYDLKDFLIKPVELIKSLAKANQLIKRIKPNVFLSFGGYLAVPLAIAARLQAIPIVTHEQTQVLGKANQLIIKLANKVAISFKETQKYLSCSAVHTGNPLRPNTFAVAKQPIWFKSTVKQPILLVMGGNQGSLLLNNFVKKNMQQLAERFIIVHQCGRDNLQSRYQAELTAQAEKIFGENQTKYYPLTWVDEIDLAWLYQHAKLVLARAGANTLFELIKAELPVILVPLDKAHLDEQLINARWAKNQGIAELIKQAELSNETFNQALKRIEQNYQQYKVAFKRIDLPKNASQKIYQLLESVVNDVKKN